MHNPVMTQYHSTVNTKPGAKGSRPSPTLVSPSGNVEVNRDLYDNDASWIFPNQFV